MQQIQKADLVSVIQEIVFVTELIDTHAKKVIKVLFIPYAMKAFKPEKLFKKNCTQFSFCLSPRYIHEQVDAFVARCFQKYAKLFTDN